MKKKLFPAAAVFVVFFLALSCVTEPPPSRSRTAKVIPGPVPLAAAAPVPAPPLSVKQTADTPAPGLGVNVSPVPFSPDGDGINDTLTMSIMVSSPIKKWQLQILEPRPPRKLFAEWNGEGAPPQTITWNGYSPSGELVQSASDYHFSLSVTNIYNNSATYEGTIEVDVLVDREGDNLRMIVPSIVFPSNSGDFRNLGTEAAASNHRVLQRIVEVLNKYPAYQVTVEGHANPTTAPGTSARADEEAGTPAEKGLRPLSEERAKAVLDYLVDLGVSRSRLSSVGLGGTMPAAEFADRDNWWKNRRVEFLLIK